MDPRFSFSSTHLIVSSFTNCILYGIYIATLISCIRWLTCEDNGWILRKKINWPMLAVTLFLCACTTAYLAILFQLTFDVISGRPAHRILLDAIPMVEFMARIVVDAVLVYRCWIVYARSWRAIALPIVLWCLCLVAFGLRGGSYTTETTLQALGPLTPAFFNSCHIINNVYATTAIVYKIMRASHTDSYTSRRLRQTTRILIESGMLYTVGGLLDVGFQSDGGFYDKSTLGGCIVDVFHFFTTGITFNLIIIRTGQARTSLKLSRDDSHLTRPSKVERLGFRPVGIAL